ncbi:hypothetical protein GCM10010520_55160 [Rhizobium viscosum]
MQKPTDDKDIGEKLGSRIPKVIITGAGSENIVVDGGPLKRFVNVEVLNSAGANIRSAGEIGPDRLFVMRLAISSLSLTSLVRNPQEFPEETIPKDSFIDIVVTSAEFEVATDGESFAQSAVGMLFLPGDGGPATLNGKQSIDFRAKASIAGKGYCHIVFKFRGAIIQSFLLTKASEVAGGRGEITVDVEFSLGGDMPPKVPEVPERDRLSMLTSMRKEGFNQLIISGRDGSDATTAVFNIDGKGLSKTIWELRGALENRAATARRRSKADLERDLKEIAPLGAKLFNQLPAQHFKTLMPLLNRKFDGVIHVARANSAEFVAPWSLVYDIPLTGKTPIVCEVVSNWDGRSDLVSGDVRQCPHGPHGKDVLCPFGFWGMRYAIEQLVSTEHPQTAIDVYEDCKIMAVQTLYDVDLASLSAHLASLTKIISARLPGATVSIQKSKASLETTLWQDMPILYFYCHGERTNPSDPDVHLGIERGQLITANDLNSWAWFWMFQQGAMMWQKTHPLVFINACSSVGIYPETLMSYVDVFIGRLQAAGVIGTEIKVHQKLAMEFAETFFTHLLLPGNTVETALRALRLDYLKEGNLFGLVYTPYCWADLHLSMLRPGADNGP